MTLVSRGAKSSLGIINPRAINITMHLYSRHLFKSASRYRRCFHRDTLLVNASDRAAPLPCRFPIRSRPMHVHVHRAVLLQPVGLPRSLRSLALLRKLLHFFFLHRAIHARALRPRTLAQMSTSRSDAYNAERERTREKRRSERSREVAERAHKHEHVSVNGMWQRRKKVKRGREECY